MELFTIGFLGIHRFEDDAAIRGAMLVTDTDMKPREFRVTAPVRPQTFQKILYGELLNEYVSVELIGVPLVNAVEEKPSQILVRDPLFLGMNNKPEIPIILMLEEDESLPKKGACTTKPLHPPDSARPPVKVFTSGTFESQLEDIAQQLQTIFARRDLMEPFYRLQKACEDVHARRVGDN